ncbi:uncharacterized protein SCHCODRAFT_02593801 [Schizophyllum commune H4-8]|uniref:uncharacterized protein n=1 Tax=Schizophyllum commune (strain H4-8 / FGSC 9210) TaxID=578458 RepID=UPI00215FBBE6|nr:uncharacterized protein SCHCODRAFT_02593801 [Schizophyllum commune H4-8]KAI5885334.1 hypothetical protein SCHCODRAFT_02593801 [Schizophyllum commune H4-8]
MSRPSLALALPTELQDVILQHLGDTSSISACAQVHRNFAAVAQSLLFSSVGLTGLTNCRTFLQLLDASPHLAAHVRQLLLTELDPRVRVRWIKEAASELTFVISMVPNLHSLAVRCADAWCESPDMDGRSSVQAPRGVDAMIRSCSSRLRALEVDLDVPGLTRPPWYSSQHVRLLALHTLVLSRPLWDDCAVRALAQAAPNVEELVLWHSAEPRGLRACRFTEEGMVSDKPLVQQAKWATSRLQGNTLLSAASLEAWRALKRIKFVAFHTLDQSKGILQRHGSDEEKERTVEDLGVLRGADGRCIRVVMECMAHEVQDGRLSQTPPLLSFTSPLR